MTVLDISMITQLGNPHLSHAVPSRITISRALMQHQQGGPSPHNMAKTALVRQHYSEAVLSTGERFSSSSLRGEDRDERWSLL